MAILRRCALVGSSLGLLLSSSLAGEGGQDQSERRTVRVPSLIDRLQSDQERHELFCVLGGINEFDILRQDGSYFLAFHPYEEPSPRLYRSENLAGLLAGESVALPPVYYPTVLVVGETWHLWGWTIEDGIQYWSAPAWNGPYERRGSIPGTQGHKGDPHVRRAPSSTFVLTYKLAQPPYWAGLMTADRPEGPWTDRGPIFENREAWHQGEEADPAIHFARDGRIYLAFAAWNGEPDRIQTIAMAELRSDFKPIGPARVLARPQYAWEMRGGIARIFNPVILENSTGTVDLYYAHNPAQRGIVAGWGRIQAR